MNGLVTSPSAAKFASDATIQQRLEIWASGSPMRVTALSETPGLNRVVRVATLGMPMRSVIVKCFCRATDVSRDHIALLRSWSASLEPAAVTRLADPILVDEDAKLVVMSDLGSDRIDDRLNSMSPDDPARSQLMSLIGRSLGEIQRFDSSGLAVGSIREHLAQLVRPNPIELIGAMPDRRSLIEATLSLLNDLSEQLVDVAPVVSHRDFHLRQLLWINSGIGVVDWDFVAAADPAFDVAYLLTYIETHGLDPDAEEARSFLDGYSLIAGPVDHAFHKRLRTYRLFNLFRRACRRFRLGDGRNDRECVRMLDLLEVSMSGMR
jgi:hypothetical protein